MVDQPPLDDVPVRHLAKVLQSAETAMRAEGIPDETIERIRNRVLWGNPDGDTSWQIPQRVAALTGGRA